MQVILFVLEVLVNPIQTEIVKSLSGNTTAFFRIENILNLAIGYTKFIHLIQHINSNLIIVFIDIALHLLQFTCGA